MPLSFSNFVKESSMPDSSTSKCTFYLDPDFPAFLVEYRGDFIREMENIKYACYYIINSTLASVAVRYVDLNRLKAEVPSILFIDFRSILVLQQPKIYEEIDSEDINPPRESLRQGLYACDTAGILPMKTNPYLHLDGTGVIIGFVDTGIDYLNEEFQTADGKTRIIALWDQSIQSDTANTHTIGKVFTSDNINEALALKAKGGDPYSIVPSKDDIGHGTNMAGIAAASGKESELLGVANNCTIAMVKVLPSENYKITFEKNGIFGVPAYNSSEFVAAIEFLKNLGQEKNKDIIIALGMGSTENSHSGSGLTARYLDKVSALPRVSVICGTGNEGSSEGHIRKVVSNSGDTSVLELIVPRIIYDYRMRIWINQANKMSINIISPSGTDSHFITSKPRKIQQVNFFKENSTVLVNFYIPEDITGLNLIEINFDNIKPGIWKFQLRGDYITDGVYNVWLPAKVSLPSGTKLLSPTPYTTLTVAATSQNPIVVGYYNYDNNSMVAASGKGYTSNNIIKPDFVAPGINIYAPKVGGGITTVSGSSVATSITAGASALFLQWGNVKGNDSPVNTQKLKSYLISGAKRLPSKTYPNEEFGYGFLDLNNSFSFLTSINRSTEDINYIEYSVNNLYIRRPM